MRRARAWLLAGTLALAAQVAVAGCGGSADGSSQGDPSVREIVASPERYYGEKMTIEAQVSRRMDHRVWEMADGRLFAIYDRGFDGAAPSPGERIRLTGTPEPLESSRIEGELSVNIEDHFFSEQFLEDDVAFVADKAVRLG